MDNKGYFWYSYKRDNVWHKRGTNYCTIKGNDNTQEAEANANLIAAAPIGHELAEFVIRISATWIDEGLLEIGEGDYTRMKELALKFREKAKG